MKNVNEKYEELKKKEEMAYRAKQAAYKNLLTARKASSDAYTVMQHVKHEKDEARDLMNAEFDVMKYEFNKYFTAWDELKKLKSEKTSEIVKMRKEADEEHSKMVDCFKKANQVYEQGERVDASFWSREGWKHQERRNALNKAVADLVCEIREAKEKANIEAPHPNDLNFKKAKAAFEAVKAKFEVEQAKFKELISEQDELKKEFEARQDEHYRIKKELFEFCYHKQL